jgi:hypothetical protein
MMIKRTTDHRFLFAAATVVYTMLLGIFYWKYVPLVAGYQSILAPILLFLTIVTAIDVRRGLLAFIFLFPLINNLPYFFKLYEPLPMAPSALVLFLFFFWGWLLHRTFAASDPAHDGENPNEPIFTPLRLFAALVAVSALITLWRYTNFFPFWRPRVYELITNAFGTSAGGAIMSVVFYSLTYLTGIAFFTILVRAVRSETFVRKAITVLGTSTLLSLAFGLFQHFKAPTLGNNPISIAAGLINATFKDALSFGAYLSMIVPLFLGILPTLKGRSRIIPALSILPAIYLLFYAGSKSALLSLAAALAALGLFVLAAVIKRRQPPVKKLIPISLFFLLLGAASIFFLVSKRAPIEALGKSTTLVRMGNFGPMLKERTSKAWTIAWKMIGDYPLSGLGVGSFIIESANDAKAYAMDIGVPQSAENLPLQIGSELGIPGVLLFLWILWEIIRRGVKSYRRAPRSSFERTLVPAAGAGLLAFFLNAQMHSYIGSYEIQYTFWFLAAVLFAAAPAPPSTDKAPARRNPIFQIAALALVVFGGISLLWSSTHSLSLQERTWKYNLRQEFGFGPIEKNAEGLEFRWSGRFAGTPCRIDGSDIEISLLASHPDLKTRPVRVKILIAPDLATKPIVLRYFLLKKSRWEKITLNVPAHIRGSALLLFEVDRTWNPMKSGISSDPRDLGLAIGNIKTSGQ